MVVLMSGNIILPRLVINRWAHNPKAVGSNPAPATKEIKGLRAKTLRPFSFSAQPRGFVPTIPESTKNSPLSLKSPKIRVTSHLAVSGSQLILLPTKAATRITIMPITACGVTAAPRTRAASSTARSGPSDSCGLFSFHPNQLIFNVFQFVAHAPPLTRAHSHT